MAHSVITAASTSSRRSLSRLHSSSVHVLEHHEPLRNSAREHSTKHDHNQNNNIHNTLSTSAGVREHHDGAGAEPGVNPRNYTAIEEWGHFQQECVIDLVDYDEEEAVFTRLNNQELISMMQDVGTKRFGGEDYNAPQKCVRWINVGGIDWGVLSALALRYNLHALALEDILHERGHNHSKADYYPEHLFLRILCHTLEDPTLPADSQDSVQNSKSRLYKEPTSDFPSDLLLQPDLMERGESPIIESPSISVAPSTSSSAGLPNSRKSKASSSEVYSGDQNSEETARNPSRAQLNKSLLRKTELRKRFTGLSGFGIGGSSKHHQQIVKNLALTRGERVDIKHEPMFIFLLRNGTVISIHPTPNLDYTSPIQERLHQPESVLRTSEDASILVESLLDLVIDRILEVMDEYQIKIHKLEHDILVHPKMSIVRSLHILSGDLTMHKRTLEPIKTMLYGLRRYDLERCAAIADHMNSIAYDQDVSDHEADKIGAISGNRHKRRKRQRMRTKEKEHVDMEKLQEEKERREREWGKHEKVKGYFSYKAKVYLADVYDHMDFALTSLDMFAGISENLIDYAFNMASYEMNRVMSRLTLATIIFLPLTLLTGYFGMNFTPFWSVDQNSDLFFWKLAIPIMAVLIPIFMYHDIQDAVRHLRRWMETA